MSAAAPYKFLKDEWVSGSSAAYAKNEQYVPRQEPPSYYAGGKVVNFDRVEWKIMPDPATASAALQRGEVDWWENPPIIRGMTCAGTQVRSVAVTDTWQMPADGDDRPC
jgi:peptide/nickel transport system substrate-binding protein